MAHGRGWHAFLRFQAYRQAQASVRLERAAVRVDRSAVQGMARITFADGSVEDFDKVILACHGDQALALLADPAELETRLLSCFKYQPNDVTLHTDASVMPRTRRCWASWNYRMERAADGSLAPTTHYWMNSLQGVSDKQQYFVSLNAEEFIAPEKILRRIQSEHPLFDVAAVAAQRELPDLNRLSPTRPPTIAGHGSSTASTRTASPVASSARVPLPGRISGDERSGRS